MFRTVADRIASRTRPTYRGRHRRARRKPPVAPVPRAPGIEEAGEARHEEEPAVSAVPLS